MTENETFEILVRATTSGTIESVPKIIPQEIKLLGNTVLRLLTYKIKELCAKEGVEKENIKLAITKLREQFVHCDEYDFQEIPPDIGIPILEEIKYVTSPTKRALYIHLLKAASKKEDTLFHPRHLQFVKGLSDSDLHFLRDLNLSETSTLLLQEHVFHFEGGGSNVGKVYDIFPKSFDRLEEPILSIQSLTQIGVLEMYRDRYHSSQQEEVEGYLAENFTKTTDGNYRYIRTKKAFMKIVNVLPKEADYICVSFQYPSYGISYMGHCFLTCIIDCSEFMTVK